MKHLDQLENNSIYILREAYANFKNLGMLWSLGKDSTVLLWLIRKAFFGQAPFPLIHIDTGYKIPEMIEYRDKLARLWKLDVLYGLNKQALENKQTFPDGRVDRISCCHFLKTEALKKTLSGEWPRYRYNHDNSGYELDKNTEQFSAVILGIRADEEGSRSKERYFSARDTESAWNVRDQPAEFWNQYKTDLHPDTSIRIHPLLDWTELEIWEYIKKENIPVVSLYYNHGNGRRYRSLGCYPCSSTVESQAATPGEIVEELKSGKFSRVAERSGRAQDKEDGGSLETLRRKGYM